MTTLKFSTTDEEGYEVEHTVPAKWAICGRCGGDGHHSNPSIDGNGITGSEWAEWEEEERETYLRGGYDVPCEEGCNDGKVRVPDWDLMTPAQREAWEEHEEEESEAVRQRWEDRQTRRMESGGWW